MFGLARKKDIQQIEERIAKTDEKIGKLLEQLQDLNQAEEKQVAVGTPASLVQGNHKEDLDLLGVYEQLLANAARNPRQARDYYAAAEYINRINKHKLRFERQTAQFDPFEKKKRARYYEEEQEAVEEEQSKPSVTPEDFEKKATELYNSVRTIFNIPDKVMGFDLAKIVQNGIKQGKEELAKNPTAVKTLDSLYNALKGQGASGSRVPESAALPASQEVKLVVESAT